VVKSPKDIPEDAIRAGEPDPFANRSQRDKEAAREWSEDEFQAKLDAIKKPWSRIVKDGALAVGRPLVLAAALGGLLTTSGHDNSAIVALHGNDHRDLAKRLQTRELTGVLVDLGNVGAKNKESLDAMRANLKVVADKLSVGQPITRKEFTRLIETKGFFENDLQLWFERGDEKYPGGSYHGIRPDEYMNIHPLEHEMFRAATRKGAADLRAVAEYYEKNAAKAVQAENQARGR